jgi:kynurenine formamidase
MASRPESAVSGTVDELVNVLHGFRAVDLTPTLYSNMPQWSTHPDVHFVSDARNFAQHGYYCQTLVMPEHSGCHVDVPAHALPDHPDETVDAFEATVLWGPAKKVDVSDRAWGPGELLELDAFLRVLDDAALEIESGDVVLVQFGWDRRMEGAEADARIGRWWGANMPGLSEELCRFLGERAPRVVGTDTAGGDIAVADGVITSGAWGHTRDFLPKGILIVEGLANLAMVPSAFYFVALPLKIAHGSGSPLRAVGLVPDGAR